MTAEALRGDALLQLIIGSMILPALIYARGSLPELVAEMIQRHEARRRAGHTAWPR
jgi:hypothetical protein